MKCATKKVLSLELSLLPFKEAVPRLLEQIKSNDRKGFACFTNVHMVVEALDDPEFAQQLTKADFLFPDGVPLTWYLKLKYKINQERIAGMDIMPALISACNEHNYSIFLYGASQETLNLMKEKITRDYPNCKLSGCISPPFRALSPDEKSIIVEEINQARPDFVLVSLGCPKQEKWCAENFSYINSYLLAVGGAFSTFIYTQKRSPIWMQKYGLEWIYRLSQEPRRLWKRYLYTNFKFIYHSFNSSFSLNKIT